MILLLIFLFTIEGVDVVAMDTGFSTELLPEADKDIFIKNVKITLLTSEPPKKAIECFDVDQNGVVAIGCSSLNNKTVCVYTSDGDFQYGYDFQCSGNFGVEVDNNTLTIYFVRSDVAVAVNPMGEIESILKIKNTPENNSYWNDSVFSTRRKVGENEYILKNEMGVFNVFASSYSQLVVTNVNCEKRVVYDVNSTQFSNVVVICIGALAFVSFVVFVVVRQFVKLKHSA